MNHITYDLSLNRFVVSNNILTEKFVCTNLAQSNLVQLENHYGLLQDVVFKVKLGYIKHCLSFFPKFSAQDKSLGKSDILFFQMEKIVYKEFDQSVETEVSGSTQPAGNLISIMTVQTPEMLRQTTQDFSQIKSIPKILDYYEDPGFDIIYFLEQTPYIFFRREPPTSKSALSGDYVFLGSDVRITEVLFVQERFFIISAVLKNPETQAESSVTYFYYFKPKQIASTPTTHMLSEINSCLKNRSRDVCFFTVHDSELKNFYKLSDESNMVFELISSRALKGI